MLTLGTAGLLEVNMQVWGAVQDWGVVALYLFLLFWGSGLLCNLGPAGPCCSSICSALAVGCGGGLWAPRVSHQKPGASFLPIRYFFSWSHGVPL